MTSPSFTQVAFRLRNDDGSESGASWKAVQGADATISAGQNFRVRFLLDETAARAWNNLTWNLYCSKNAGAYTLIGSGQPVNYSLSDNFVQGDDCTSQLTGGSGTFVTDNNGMAESAAPLNTGVAGQYFELEYCLQIDPAQVADGDTLALRVYNGTAAIAAYTDWPVITVSEPISIALNTATLTASGVILDVQPGEVTISLDTPSAVAGGVSLQVDYTTNLNTAIAQALGVVITVSAVPTEPVLVNLSTALLTTVGVSVIPLLFQIIRPSADASLGSWTDVSGGTTNIYQSIDESVPNDADLVQSPVLPAANTYKFKLSTASDPAIHIEHTVSYRFRKPFNVDTTTLTLRFLQGAAVLDTWVESVTDAWQTKSRTLSEAVVANITDYSDLYIELEAA